MAGAALSIMGIALPSREVDERRREKLLGVAPLLVPDAAGAAAPGLAVGGRF